MNIRRENAKKIKALLDRIGPCNSSVRTQSEWAFLVFYSDRDDTSLTIEMCLQTDFRGDPLFDPLMKIKLILDPEGNPVEAIPLYYLCQTLFYNEEIYAEGNPSCYDPALYRKSGELDERLAEWLESLKIQGYLTGGVITPIRHG